MITEENDWLEIWKYFETDLQGIFFQFLRLLNVLLLISPFCNRLHSLQDVQWDRSVDLLQCVAVRQI